MRECRVWWKLKIVNVALGWYARKTYWQPQWGGMCDIPTVKFHRVAFETLQCAIEDGL